MSAIPRDDSMRFFERAYGVQFIDAANGKPVREAMQKEGLSKTKNKSDCDRWLDGQDKATKLVQIMGEI